MEVKVESKGSGWDRKCDQTENWRCTHCRTTTAEDFSTPAKLFSAPAKFRHPIFRFETRSSWLHSAQKEGKSELRVDDNDERQRRREKQWHNHLIQFLDPTRKLVHEYAEIKRRRFNCAGQGNKSDERSHIEQLAQV